MFHKCDIHLTITFDIMQIGTMAGMAWEEITAIVSHFHSFCPKYEVYVHTHKSYIRTYVYTF